MTNRTAAPRASQAPVTGIRTSACRIPADLPEADRTFAWHATTLILVEADADDLSRPGRGLEFSARDAAAYRID